VADRFFHRRFCFAVCGTLSTSPVNAAPGSSTVLSLKPQPCYWAIDSPFSWIDGIRPKPRLRQPAYLVGAKACNHIGNSSARRWPGVLGERHPIYRPPIRCTPADNYRQVVSLRCPTNRTQQHRGFGPDATRPLNRVVPHARSRSFHNVGQEFLPRPRFVPSDGSSSSAFPPRTSSESRISAAAARPSGFVCPYPSWDDKSRRLFVHPAGIHICVSSGTRQAILGTRRGLS